MTGGAAGVDEDTDLRGEDKASSDIRQAKWTPEITDPQAFGMITKCSQTKLIFTIQIQYVVQPLTCFLETTLTIQVNICSASVCEVGICHLVYWTRHQWHSRAPRGDGH